MKKRATVALPTPAKVVDDAGITPTLQGMWGAAGWVDVPGAGSTSQPAGNNNYLWSFDPHLGGSIRVLCNSNATIPLTIVGFAAP